MARSAAEEIMYTEIVWLRDMWPILYLLCRCASSRARGRRLFQLRSGLNQFVGTVTNFVVIEEQSVSHHTTGIDQVGPRIGVAILVQQTEASNRRAIRIGQKREGDLVGIGKLLDLVSRVVTDGNYFCTGGLNRL